jgi:hypothetical protein
MDYNYISLINKNKLHLGIGYGGPWLFILRAKVGEHRIEMDAATYRDKGS